MGMFDTVTFRYRMPDGVTGTDFQTRDLDCECESYEILSDGRLMRREGNGVLTDTGFDGMLALTADTADNDYYLHFTQGTLKWMEMCQEPGKHWPFEPGCHLAGLG